MLVGGIFIGMETLGRNRRLPERFRVSPLAAIGLFVTRGYFAYEERRSQIDRDVRSEPRGNDILNVTNSIRLAILAEQGFRQSQQSRVAASSKVLDLAVNVVAAQIPQAEQHQLTANYMRIASCDDVVAQQRLASHFPNVKLEDCVNILVLEQFDAARLLVDLALPVSKLEDRCLPGASLACYRRDIEIVITKSAKFGSAVPKMFQTELKKVLHIMRFDSFLCVPMQKGGEILGILCVGAKTEIFDPNDPRSREIAESLHPICMSLANLLP
jgi:hypothetical protein